jgi:hypothetical protein
MRYLAVIFCAVFVLFSLHEAQTKIIHVPADSSSIHTGINGAAAITDGTTYYVKKVEESIVISEPLIKETNEYVTVNLQEATSSLSKAGEPVLPVVTKVFTLPLGSKISHVDVSFSEGNKIGLSKPVQLGPEPIPKTGMRVPKETVKNSEIYESVELYPSNSFSYSMGAGIKGDERVIFLTVHCYPVRYSPSLGMLYYSERVDIRVTYEEPIVPISFPDVYDMVIIAPSMFSEELQPLIDHKNDRGVQTVLKTTEEIYGEYTGRDEPEKIKYFIKDAIETWNVRFVLLVGGAAQVPGRYTHIYFEYDYQDEWVFLSDLYYADVYDEELNFSSWDSNENDVFGEYNWYGNTDEVDLYPDVYLGRLACVNESQVITCVNKIITYETEKAHTQDWFTNLVLMGGDSLPGDEEQVDEGEYVNQHVIDTLDWFIPTRVWASNGLLYDAANISDAINDGAGFVFFNGHGNTTVWATHPHESYQWIPPGSYTNSHINALSNGNQLPIVISDACYHCQYDVASYCFGWTFITNPNGGAIGYLGGTDIDVSYGGVDIVTKGIERLCVIMTTNYKNGDATFGELWGNGITTYLSPVMDEIDYITVEEFQPFGDPSLLIAGDSQKPVKPTTPEGEIEGSVGQEYTYTSSTTDPDGDSLYYLFYWGDETYSEWVGPHASGEVAEAGHTWTDSGSYQIKVIAKDENGVFSEWSGELNVAMFEYVRGDANGDGVIDIADVVYLINYLFIDGPAPEPLEAGNANCDEVVDIADVVYLINYLFIGGPPPCEP